MAKDKAGKGKSGAVVPNRPIYSRMSFLYQAAAYLSSHASDVSSHSANASNSTISKPDLTDSQHQTQIGEALSRRLITDMRSTAKKTQIRLSPAIKHTVCKYCDTLLIEGQTSTTSVENLSKNGRKPWADVLVIRCHSCEKLKRFPVQASRQKRRPLRRLESAEDTNMVTTASAALLSQDNVSAPFTSSGDAST